jgi:hypothetical protein
LNRPPRRADFWATLLIGLGILLLLRNLDLIGDVAVAPVILIVVGLAVLGSAVFGRSGTKASAGAIPLDGAASATIRIDHGAGELRIAAGPAPGNLLDGQFLGPVEQQVHRAGDRVDVRIKADSGVWDWWWANRRGLDWRIAIASGVPTSLEIHAGASSSDLDLHDLAVTDLLLETGASKTEVTAPARGRSSVRVRAGAASVRIRIPGSTAARIESGGLGLASLAVDQRRFPSLGGNVYQSPGYDEAADRVDVRVEGGAASFSVS